MKNLKKIKGDASFRKYYRKLKDNSTSILVISKKDKFKNLLAYDAINKILNKNKILAPKLYQENYKKGYLEIQDFGDKTIFLLLKKNNKKKFFYFKKIIQILNKLQTIKNRKITDFKNNLFVLRKYEKKLLIEEANLFCDWYAKKN